MVKEVFAAFPADAVAGPRQFRGQAAMGDQSARWDLAITGEQPPLRPLRPQALYQAPLPRTKLEATVYGEAWRAPIGRIHWAGAECAPEWNGYMGGAVRSGEAAADIADEEDRDLVLADLETIPGQPRYW